MSYKIPISWVGSFPFSEWRISF